MKTHHFFWSLIRALPWLYMFNCLSITLVFVFDMIAGLVAQNFFDRLTAHTANTGLWWIAALLLLSGAGRIAFLAGWSTSFTGFIGRSHQPFARRR